MCVYYERRVDYMHVLAFVCVFRLAIIAVCLKHSGYLCISMSQYFYIVNEVFLLYMCACSYNYVLAGVVIMCVSVLISHMVVLYFN